jgi:hypothetical protein
VPGLAQVADDASSGVAEGLGRIVHGLVSVRGRRVR